MISLPGIMRSNGAKEYVPKIQPIKQLEFGSKAAIQKQRHEQYPHSGQKFISAADIKGYEKQRSDALNAKPLTREQKEANRIMEEFDNLKLRKTPASIPQPERIKSLPFKKPIPFVTPGRFPRKEIIIPAQQLYAMPEEQDEIEDNRRIEEIGRQTIRNIAMDKLKARLRKAEE